MPAGDPDPALAAENLAFAKGQLALAEERDIPCYISLEERMACGIGACLACTCESVEVDEHTKVKKKRICKDGPVFLSTEVTL